MLHELYDVFNYMERMYSVTLRQNLFKNQKYEKM